MVIWKAILLGIVQGLTEFLPVSSTGHLVLLEKVLGTQANNLQFEVMVHLGTLAVVLVVFRHRIAKIIKAVLFKRIRYRKGKFRFSDENTRLFLLLSLATVPAALVGLFLDGAIARHLLTPRWVALMLLITGGIFFGTRFIGKLAGKLNWRNSIMIGLAQALAILPGISRSGSTIAAGLYLGVEKEKATEFSFLLLIPIVLGAGVLKIGEMIVEGVALSQWISLLVGAVTAALFGYLAIKLLLRVVKHNHLHYFAYYCWLLGITVLWWVK